MERVLQKIIVSKSSSRFSGAAILLLLAACTPSPDVETRITHVTDGYFGRSLAESMEANKVPGVSITVIDDYEIEWARGFGVLSVDGNKKVTPETLFPASSISKGVTSAIALTMVEQGLLDLDENVNERLTSWRVPENEFTEREKVTLLRLLDHTACVNRPEGGFGHAGTYPSTIQILNGESPATNHAARIVCVPGSEIRYSNIGYVIVQQLIDDVSGTPFAEMATEALFKPIGIESSTFEQPLPKPLEQLAAMPHDLEGKSEPLAYNPNAVAQGGLWTAPSDLARLTCEIMRSREGLSDRVLSQKLTKQMLYPHHRDLSGGNFWGLGFLVLGDWAVLQAGSDPGFRCLLAGFPKMGKGIVIMLNGDGGELLQLGILLNYVAQYLLLPVGGYLIAGGCGFLTLVSLFVVWPLGFLWNRFSRSKSTSAIRDPTPRLPRRMAVLAAATLLVAIYPYCIYIFSPRSSTAESGEMLWLSLLVGLLLIGTTLSCCMVWLAYRLWKERRWSVVRRTYYSIITLAVVSASFLWWKLLWVS